MGKSKGARWALALSASVLAMSATAAEAQQQGGQAATGQQQASVPTGPADATADIVVTANRREERLQNVPLAVSAFSQEALQQKQINGGSQLEQSVPNVQFNRTNLGGFNFQIRGVGTKVAATGLDQATGVHVNNSPLMFNTLADSEFYDVERVEVLRGPQGTLYGRNSTGGVVNIITAKPTYVFEGSLEAGISNYEGRRFRGMVNLPIVADVLSVRLAGTYLKRDGFARNLVSGEPIDGRDLYSWRATVRLDASPRLHAFAVYERFNENDDRVRSGKLLCAKDSGPSSVGSVPLTAATQGSFTQGCRAVSIYSPEAQGTIDTRATSVGGFGNIAGIIAGDANAGKTQPSGFRDFESTIIPQYRSRNESIQGEIDWEVFDKVTLSGLVQHSTGSLYTLFDYNRSVPVVKFNTTPLTPGGVFIDPQLGPSNGLQTLDSYRSNDRQTTGEIRLHSDLNGLFDFSLGASFLDYDQLTQYLVISNTLTAFAQLRNGNQPCALGSTTCIYIDPRPYPVDGTLGHNYFTSYQPYRLRSRAAFGEVYLRPLDGLKLTAGLRYTHDDKSIDNYDTVLLQPGSGVRRNAAVPTLNAKFGELTGKVGVDYKTKLGFTDSTLLYAVASRGYKSGGPNQAGAAGLIGIPVNYAPEFVNAFEAGAKNTFAHGAATANLTGFYYDYKGYQLQKLVNRATGIENFNATIWGLEFEATARVFRAFSLNASLGYLNTRLGDGTSLDTFNRTQGDPTLTLIKANNFSSCTAPTAQLATLLQQINAGLRPASTLTQVCSNAVAGVTPSDGIRVSVKGNELPNAPHFTMSLGAEYRTDVTDDVELRGRVDFSLQSRSFARVFNTAADYLKGRSNTNVSLTLSDLRRKLSLQLYVSNLFNQQNVTDFYVGDESNGLLRNVFLTEPRVYGAKLGIRF